MFDMLFWYIKVFGEWTRIELIRINIQDYKIFQINFFLPSNPDWNGGGSRNRDWIIFLSFCNWKDYN